MTTLNVRGGPTTIDVSGGTIVLYSAVLGRFPGGGDEGEVLTKSSNASYDVEWAPQVGQVPAGGTTGQILAKASNVTADLEWIEPGEAVVDFADDGELNAGKSARSSDHGLSRSSFPQSFPLAKWLDALADVDNTPVDIVWFGDSVTQGYNTTDHSTKSPPSRLETYLAARFNSKARRRGWVPMDAGTDPEVQEWDTVQGSSNAYGLGGWGRTLTAASSHYCEIAEHCDSFDLYYTKQKSGGGDLQVRIDGSLVTTINTLDTGLGPARDSGNKWSSAALTPGTHTIRVTAATSGTAMVDGIYLHEGNKTSGVRVFNGGHGGAATQSFAKTTPYAGTGGYPGALEHIANNDPALVIIDLGRNDPAFGGLTAAESADALDTLIDEIQAASSACSILVISSYKPSFSSLWDTWYDYRDGQRLIVREQDVALLDLGDAMGEMTSNYGSADGLHVGDTGAEMIAQMVLSVIVPSALDPAPAVLTDGSRVMQAPLVLGSDYTLTSGEGGLVGNHMTGGAGGAVAGLWLRSLPKLKDSSAISSDQHFASIALTHIFGLLSSWEFVDENDSGRTTAQIVGRNAGAAGSAYLQMIDRLIVKRGSSGQTENLQEWQDQTGAVISKVTPQGGIANLAAAVTQSSSFTFALTDQARRVEVTSSSAVTATVDTNANVAFPTGTKIEVVNLGAGSCIITPTSGTVTIYSATGLALGQYATGVLEKIATNTWVFTASPAQVIVADDGGSSCSGTTSATSLFATANMARPLPIAGDVFKFEAWGTIVNVTGGALTSTLTFSLGGTALFTAFALSVGSFASEIWRISSLVRVPTIGSSVSEHAITELRCANGANENVDTTNSREAFKTLTVTNTSVLNYTLTATHSSNSGSFVTDCKSAVLERVRKKAA